jgi:hypothetical protein
MATPPTSPHPLQVRGELDPQLSRWQWLVKLLLGIPHYIVLIALWILFLLLGVVALVAILISGRYPRAIFDFNVGVLRWTWRVAFWSYGALATDRYPPFSLEHRPHYPATLEIAYPEQLSRGLALVKWWLLAIPHYLVVAALLGGNAGLVPLLVLFAGIALLFANRYPRGIFDIAVGGHRWALRTAAYAALMTDVYPPFRLDLGGEEPPVSAATP